MAEKSKGKKPFKLPLGKYGAEMKSDERFGAFLRGDDVRPGWASSDSSEDAVGKNGPAPQNKRIGVKVKKSKPEPRTKYGKAVKGMGGLVRMTKGDVQ